jgi:Trypsin-like peptidase domain
VVHYYASIGSRYAHKFPVEVIARDPGLDLAVLSFPEIQPWKPVEFGESLPVPPSAHLFVLGFPLNFDLSSGDGVLSNRRGPGGRWQTTLPLNYGDSGGPVFDIGGKVVGIAAGGFDSAKLITIVIPADYARPLRSMIRAAALKPSGPDWKIFTFMKSVEDQQAAELKENFCLPAGKRVVSFKPQILSRNGQETRLVSAKPDPNRPNCIELQGYVAGNGVERYGSIVVDHKGRGWLSGYVTVYGTP